MRTPRHVLPDGRELATAHAGDQPPRRTRVRLVSERQALGTPEAGAGSVTEAGNYREGVMRRATTFRVGHPAFEESGPASYSTHQLEI